jgi:hypothetical protein
VGGGHETLRAREIRTTAWWSEAWASRPIELCVLRHVSFLGKVRSFAACRCVARLDWCSWYWKQFRLIQVMRWLIVCKCRLVKQARQAR